MVLDMESEFYKLAKTILRSERNLYKLLSLEPSSGRLSVMGSKGGILVGPKAMDQLMNGPEKAAYRFGKSSGKDLFGGLVKEFDEEVSRLGPKKLMELALAMSRALGWGDLRMKALDRKGHSCVIEAERAIEQASKKATHMGVTSGYLAGISTVCFGTDMSCTPLGEKKGVHSFSVSKARG